MALPPRPRFCFSYIKWCLAATGETTGDGSATSSKHRSLSAGGVRGADLGGGKDVDLGFALFSELVQSEVTRNTGDVYRRRRISDCLRLEGEEGEEEGEMSRRGKTPRLDLRLNLSIPRGGGFSAAAAGGGRGVTADAAASPNISPSSSSSPSSCLSSETDQGRYASSPEAMSMVLLGCPRCLMYVMLSEDDPKCPKCKSSVLLDFLNDPKNAATAKSRKN